MAGGGRWTRKGPIALLLVTASTAAEPALAPAAPADVGMDAAALKEAVSLIGRAVADDQLRGSLLLVWRSPPRLAAIATSTSSGRMGPGCSD